MATVLFVECCCLSLLFNRKKKATLRKQQIRKHKSYPSNAKREPGQCKSTTFFIYLTLITGVKQGLLFI